MKLKKLFRSMKECKRYKDDFYIKPKVAFEIDEREWMFVLLPTITVRPWTVRYPGECIIAIRWLNFGIALGKWCSKERK